jgi:rod shape-determining protein MreC
MRDLIQLFVRSGGFITFFLLECVCLFLIVSFNKTQRGIWLHSAGTYTGAMEKKRNELNQYLNLKTENDRLNTENAQIKAEMENNRMVRLFWRDTFRTVLVDTIGNKSTNLHYRFFPATVINNTVNSFNNYLTIDRGSKDGVRPCMGVLAPDGVVGIVREVTENYSLVLSMLNRQSKISASLKKTGHFGSLIWEGTDPLHATLNDIPKHVTFAAGDTIVTSGFSEIFPKNIMVGIVENSKIEAGSNFFTINVRLSADLSRAQHVFVVDHLFQNQFDTLQTRVGQ